MKIDHLPIGARFQWKGITYTKTGPMTAAGDSGGTAFIPKHAVLQPVPGEAPPAVPQESSARTVDAARVLAAFESYHRKALTLTDEAAQAELEEARQRFLAALR